MTDAIEAARQRLAHAEAELRRFLDRTEHVAATDYAHGGLVARHRAWAAAEAEYHRLADAD